MMSTDNPWQRPFKVWSADRSLRKGVLAYSLTDLIRKGRVKLEIQDGENIAVVLESDGTEVDDDYFRRLEDNTIVLLLKGNERWYPPGLEAIRAAIHAIPRIVCDAINTLELIDEAPSWKIMDNRGRVTVVLHWDQKGKGSGTRLSKDADGTVVIEEPSAAGGLSSDGSLDSRRSPPILISAKIEGMSLADGAKRLERMSSIPMVKKVIGGGSMDIPRVASPDMNGAVCDFHCCALHEEGGRIHVNKSVATSPIQEQQQQQQQQQLQAGSGAQPPLPQPPDISRRPSPKGGAHVRFLDVHLEPVDQSSESDTENTANEDEQLSERYLLLVDQLSVEQKRHLTIKDIGIILERLSSKIVDVERLEREKESEDVHNWTIKATIRGEVLRELGIIYNGHFYAISEHPGYF